MTFSEEDVCKNKLHASSFRIQEQNIFKSELI